MPDQKVTKDTANKRMVIEHTFKAPRSKVWRAWASSTELDKCVRRSIIISSAYLKIKTEQL